MCITEKKTNKSSYPEPHAQTHIFPLQQTKSRGGGHVLHKQTHTTKHDSIKGKPMVPPPRCVDSQPRGATGFIVPKSI